MPRPDAIFIPESYKGSGATQFQRIDNLLDVAEPILEVDRDAGERGYIRKQPGGSCFVTRDPNDTIRCPKNHPRFPGQDRYRWEAHPTLNGVRVGFLKEGHDAA